MRKIHQDCYETTAEIGYPRNYVIGANIVGFRHIAEAVLAFGVI